MLPCAQVCRLGACVVRIGWHANIYFFVGRVHEYIFSFPSGVRAEREREREIMKWFVCVLNLKFLSYKTFFISIAHINNCI